MPKAHFLCVNNLQHMMLSIFECYTMFSVEYVIHIGTEGKSLYFVKHDLSGMDQKLKFFKTI